MQSASAKNLGREVKLLFPVADGRASEKALGPFVHFARHLFSDLQKNWIAVDGQLEIALIVERHGRNLAERVLAVEHPAVGAGQKGIRDIANAIFHRCIRFCRGSRPLNPLPLEILGNLTADKITIAGVLNLDLGPSDGRLGVEKSNSLLVS